MVWPMQNADHASLKHIKIFPKMENTNLLK